MAEMSLIQWDERYSVGVSALDADHRTLVNLINQLDESCRARPEQRAVAALLDRLKSNIAEHFAREEAMMERLEYPELADHWNHHVETNATLQRIFERAAVDAAARSEAAEFLKRWFIAHALGADGQLRRFFIDKGVADLPLQARGGWLRTFVRRLFRSG
jgi:hemerythrin-like metal-binding protein